MAVEKYPAVNGEGFEKIENGCAWHGGTAKAWANTPYSRILDPVCRSMFDGIKAIAENLKTDIYDNSELRDSKAYYHGICKRCKMAPAPTSAGRFNVQGGSRRSLFGK